MKKCSSTYRFKITLLLLIGGATAIISCSNNTVVNPGTEPSITAINPLRGPVNSTVAIKGKNFSRNKAVHKVTFGTTRATVNSASDTALTVTVPEGLTNGSKYVVRDSVDGKATIAPKRFTVALPPDTADAVPADGVLEAVTWNLLQFQAEDAVKFNNDILVTDSLNADLFAFQEVLGKDAAQALAGRMKGYKAIYDKTTNQGNAFVYNTNAIEPIDMGKITMGQMSHPWAGRLPYFFLFNYNPGGGNPPVKVYAVVIHAKAGGGDENYQRRVQAAQELYDFLTNQKPDANTILLGDFNDETTKSFVDDNPSPYKPFVDDKEHYDAVTFTLSQQDKTSETGFQTVVDNIIISNEVVKYYLKGSVRVFIPTEDFIPDYANTTSDHYPVEAKFDLTR